MIENGKVIWAEGDRAKVSIQKKTACDKCGMCIFPKGSNEIIFEVINPINAKVGDSVNFQMNGRGKLSAILLAFIVPLLLIGISVAIGTLILQSELIALIASIVCVVVWYAILAVIDKKRIKSGKTCPIIIEITNKEN